MAKSITFRDEFVIINNNLNKARQILKEEWQSMTDSDKKTWHDNKKYENDNGQSTFLDYYLRTFSLLNSNTIQLKSITLLSGTDKTFTNRSTRLWNGILGGFGTLTYGVASYGSSR